jgi:hypothetical protein
MFWIALAVAVAATWINWSRYSRYLEGAMQTVDRRAGEMTAECERHLKEFDRLIGVGRRMEIEYREVKKQIEAIAEEVRGIQTSEATRSLETSQAAIKELLGRR